jgi:AcrR family transcriptional regulator
MSNLRMTSDLRRQLILGAAKRCFARNGFAGTTTKSVAAAAAISEGLLFKHFPSKAALYAEILAEECEADPDLAHLLGQEPSTATLVELVKGMVGHFLQISDGPDEEEAQRVRLMASSRRICPAALQQDRRPDRIGLHRLDRERDRFRRCRTDRRRAAQPVLVRPPHRADGGADTAARYSLS